MQYQHIQKMRWVVDPSGLVVEPPYIGDSEIRTIDMNLSECVISLFTSGEAEEFGQLEEVEFQYQIKMRDPKYLSFTSDHLQNVVEAIHIFAHDEVERARSFTSFSGRMLFPKDLEVAGLYYIFIVPITGGELFAVADDFEIHLFTKG